MPSRQDRRPARKIPPSTIIAAVPCTFCGANAGARCWNSAHGREITGAHWQRRKDFERSIGRRPKLRGNVTVTFSCPVCGGPHSRADHPGDQQNAPHAA